MHVSDNKTSFIDLESKILKEITGSYRH